jgi:uncharacterized protein (TIRG00374 family)
MTAGKKQDPVVPDTAAISVSSKGVHPVYWIVSLTLAGVLLYFSVRGIDWGRVGVAMLSARVPYVLAYLAIYSAALFLRAYRWRVLLTSEGQVSVPTAFWATCAGYFGNNFLPARAGELVRTLLISSRCNLSRTFVLTTAMSERLTDAIVLVVISAIILMTVKTGPGWLSSAARPLAIAAICGVTMIILIPRFDRTFKGLISLAPLRVSLRERLVNVLDQVVLGVKAYHDRPRLLAFIALTMVIWCTDAIGTTIGARALHLSISLPVAFLLIAGLGVGSALPSTPGYVGVYQFVAVSILVPFGFTRTDSILYILFAQAVSYAVIGSWGLVGFWKLRKHPVPSDAQQPGLRQEVLGSVTQ